ncbi:protein kinase 4 [Aedes albopictus]|uniref:Uncharacterized protein n=1 Tax=Aedes albopictus TaxID=7160 RepID=A0ABM1Y744_AEDAL
MSSSPGDNRYTFESPENKNNKPLYPSTDSGFLPLGFSTPQQQRNSGPSSHQRNYYSAQPKYMLPRQRGFHNRNRNPQQQQQEHQQQQQHQGGNEGSPADSEERPQERRQFHHNRDWKGQQNFQSRSNNNRFQQQQQQHHQRRNRFGLGHNQGKDNDGKYNINDYFHPSMLEDPWQQLVQQNERSKAEEGDSSDAGGGGSGSDAGDD